MSKGWMPEATGCTGKKMELSIVCHDLIDCINTLGQSSELICPPLDYENTVKLYTHVTTNKLI